GNAPRAPHGAGPAPRRYSGAAREQGGGCNPGWRQGESSWVPRDCRTGFCKNSFLSTDPVVTGSPACKSRRQVPYLCRCTHGKPVRRYVAGHNCPRCYQRSFAYMDPRKDSYICANGCMIFDHRPYQPADGERRIPVVGQHRIRADKDMIPDGGTGGDVHHALEARVISYPGVSFNNNRSADRYAVPYPCFFTDQDIVPRLEPVPYDHVAVDNGT